jgi:hypothetical protein
MKVLLHYELSAKILSNAFKEKLGNKNIEFFNLKDNIKDFDMDKYDLIVFQAESFFDKNLTKILNYNTSATKIYCDLDDDFFIKRIYNNDNINLYFKRELYKNISLSYKLEWSLRYTYGRYIITPTYRNYNIYGYINTLSFPLCFGTIGKSKKLKSINLFSKIPNRIDANREIDLSFMMNFTDISARKNVYNFLTNLQINEKYKNHNLFIPHYYMKKEQYLNKLSDSKASISIRGMGWDTFRYWEIPSYGAMLISQRLPIIIRNNFVDGESALFFSTNKELYKKIKTTIINSDEWREISRKGRQNILKYHTPKKRAEYILNCVKEI